MHLWCSLIDQDVIKINLLRPSHVNPCLSYHDALEGTFNYNATPLAPPGTQVLIHEKPTQRASWDAHAIDGWYVGPDIHHSLCFTVFVKQTGAIIISDTVELIFPRYSPFQLSPRDLLTDASQTITSSIKNPHPPGIFPLYGESQLQELTQLAAIFKLDAHQQNRKPSKATHSVNNNIPPVPPHNKPVTPIRLIQQPFREKENVSYAIHCPSTCSPLEYKQLMKTPSASIWIQYF